MLVMFWAAGLLLASIERGVFAAYRRQALARGENDSRAAIVGCGDLGRVVADRVRRYETLGYELVGFVSANGAPEDVSGYPVLGEFDDLPAIIDEHEID